MARKESLVYFEFGQQGSARGEEKTTMMSMGIKRDGWRRRRRSQPAESRAACGLRAEEASNPIGGGGGRSVFVSRSFCLSSAARPSICRLFARRAERRKATQARLGPTRGAAELSRVEPSRGEEKNSSHSTCCRPAHAIALPASFLQERRQFAESAAHAEGGSLLLIVVARCCCCCWPPRSCDIHRADRSRRRCLLFSPTAL